MDKLKIDPTSALFLKWGLKAFDPNAIEAFVKHIDITSADKLYDECSLICNWYDEVILNRKYFIAKTIEEILARENQNYTILNLAAGKTPLAIHLLTRNKERITKIIEVDNWGMEEKQEIYDRYYPEISDKIKCISADITSDSFLLFIQQIINEYFEGNPCIVILEGIIYYLKPDEFIKIIKKFNSPKKSNTVIIEYLLHDSLIKEDRKEIPYKVFEKLKSEMSIETISSYKRDYITTLFNENGGEFICNKNLMDMEKERTGTNKYFNGIEEGWIECSVWKL